MPTAPNTPLERMRDRAHAALSRGDVILQAYELLNVLGDAVADCEDERRRQAGDMTRAEARSAYEAVAYEEAVSIALEGLEVIYGESFLPDAVALPAPTLSATTLTLCERAIDNRLTEVEAERERLLTYRPEAREHAQHLLELDTEVRMIQDALAELGRVLAITPGASAA
jgi:hypothetical protein